MSLGKKDIIQNIKSKAHISNNLSKSLLEEFLSLIKDNRYKKVKLSNFGVFYRKETSPRMGRNPKTGQDFKIPMLRKLSFKASNVTKRILN